MKRKYKVLLTSMTMNIGGAETHVYELALGLQKRGFQVSCISNGGILANELEMRGIQHIYAPLHSKKPFHLLQSFFILAKWIRKEKIDLVHCHSRISATLCHYLRYFISFHLLTTTHGIRNKMPFTRFGEHTIAVSEEIKAQIVRDFHYPEEQITVSVNGIDLERFQKRIPPLELYKEWNIHPAQKLLVHVSRLDSDRSHILQTLLDAAAIFLKEDPAVFLIVGDGDLIKVLQTKAQSINQKLGRNAIIFTGKRSDIPEILNMADVFIGSERSALEAMACEKKLILASEFGYLGILDEQKMKNASIGNFTLRQTQPLNANTIAEDMLVLMNQYVETNIFRQFIKNNYSADRMIDESLQIYRYLLEGKRCLISGYYGFNNAGDESILMTMLEAIRLKNPYVRLTVLSKNPSETNKNYKVRAIYRFHLIRVFIEICRSDVVVSGGGSLIQDRTSSRSLWYYISIIAIAKIMRKKVMLYANGIGPVTHQFNRKWVARILNKVDCITLREEGSKNELLDMDVNQVKLHVTADPVFAISAYSSRTAKMLLEAEQIPVDKPLIGISLRNWYKMDDFINELAICLDQLIIDGDMNVLFIVMQHPEDLEICKKIQRKMRKPSYILEKNHAPADLITICAYMKIICSMRLHALIYAATQHVPAIGFVYDPKIEYYLDVLGLPNAGFVENFNKENFQMIFKDILANYSFYKTNLEKKAAYLQDKAHENENYLTDLIEG